MQNETARYNRIRWWYFAALSLDDGRLWPYIYIGPSKCAETYREYVGNAAKGTDPRYYAVIDRSSLKAVGTFSLIWVGKKQFSPLLKRSTLSTEAQFLLMAYDSMSSVIDVTNGDVSVSNAPSWKAAKRLGIMFEGIFQSPQTRKLEEIRKEIEQNTNMMFALNILNCALFYIFRWKL